jgi:hypothetical protein
MFKFLSEVYSQIELYHRGSNHFPLMSKGENNFRGNMYHHRGILHMKLECFH